MAFKLGGQSEPIPENPEELFSDLRSRSVAGLLSHQADVLREYLAAGLEADDVALQLPTGSGKTLVGLLIGEWRRRKFGHRVVYLCPTNQLVNQVAAQAQGQYGMRVAAFTGPKANYDPITKTEYQNSEVLAVTSYSALFNVNPFFSDANTIVLDDSHSAENYIASFWSLRIDRYLPEHSPVYEALTAILRGIIPHQDYVRMQSGPMSAWDNTWVDKLPTLQFQNHANEIASCLDVTTRKTKLNYTWSVIKDHLSACHMYVSVHEILIRPLIPPSSTHPPFASAEQRIYMSATLGAGGDLERITGRAPILRLQVPKGWDKQGIGRRFFLMPGRSLDEAQEHELLVDAIKESHRAMVLVPDSRTAANVAAKLKKDTGFQVFDAREIEASKEPFVASNGAVAVVANRYDGIDLVGDECRLLVMIELPRSTNLQEKFLLQRMGATYCLTSGFARESCKVSVGARAHPQITQRY